MRVVVAAVMLVAVVVGPVVGDDRLVLAAHAGEARAPGGQEAWPGATVEDGGAQRDAASNDWMFVSAIAGGCLLITLVLLLCGPQREPRDDLRHRPHGGGRLH